MYLKIENENVTDVTPQLPMRKHLKVGTFKFESRGTLRGERFIKKIFDHALECDADDIYVTVYQNTLILLDYSNRLDLILLVRKVLTIMRKTFY